MTSYSAYPWAEITAIEDPVTGLMIDFGMFLETYRPLLESLDGLDLESQVETWLEPSPLNRSHLRFVNDDVKTDWIDLAICESCIPTLREVREGENSTDRLKRFHIKAPRQAKIHKPSVTGVQDQLKKIHDVTTTIQHLKVKLVTAQTEGKATNGIAAKLERASLLLNKLSNVTV